MMTGTKKQRATTIACAAFAALYATSCSSSSSDDGPKPDKTPPTVTATPGSLTWTSGTQDVELTATDNKDSDPAIYYTLDGTIPTDASTAYVAGTPINLTATTILRMIGVDKKGNTSESFLEGYVYAPTSIEQAWADSGHGHITAEAFRHWDEDGEVSASCARCHNGDGYHDYLEDGVTDNPGPLPNLGHYCTTCHTTPPNTLYDDLGTYPFLEPIEFPSGSTASVWGPSNMCISCHMGRESGQTIDDAILNNPAGPYTFINIHYYAAAATFFGNEVRGGYEYSGMSYTGRNSFGSHPEENQTCIGCHMRGDTKDHTFVPQVSDCTTCHTGSSFETLSGSPGANYTAITTLSDELLTEIDDYATNVLGFPIAYNPSAYPYFFFDTNNNNVADPKESVSSNRFDEFDASLLKAAYNYQVVQKEPAGYIHNGTYFWQLLSDSIADLGGTASMPAPGRSGWDQAGATKSQQWHTSGHAASANEPFRHWDEDGEVSASCARCHSRDGFIDYVADGTTDNAAPLGTLVDCYACHNNLDLFANDETRHDDLVTNTALEPVTFPSGQTATFNNNSNMCMTCHQGRESGLSIDTKTANSEVQTPDYDSYDFVNRHYYAAGAILFGSDVTAAYQYSGQTYDGQNLYASHPANIKDCSGCHMRDAADHTFRPMLGDCTSCHTGITDFEQLGKPFGGANTDYDGDGTGESFNDEIAGMRDLLYAEIQDYARNGLNGGLNSSPIVYSGSGYPYWFKDLNDNGVVDAGEDDFANRYRDFDRELLRAAFNYHSAQDPCGDIHNFSYVLQTIYDSADVLDDGTFNDSFAGGIATRP